MPELPKIQVLCSFRAESRRRGDCPPALLMRNSVAFLLLLLALAGSLEAQPLAPRPHPEVPARLDVAGLHLVLNTEAQRLVQQKADGLSRHQPSFQARVDLADASFPIIDRVLQEEGVPLDFRYLALQESALQGDARSNHDAVGYWQLKPETATGLGLTVNDAVDERQHLAASTRAAARYLIRNNASLHNWLDALLSYYTGLGGVKPYTLPTNFDATEMAITEATSPYVLMFLAQKIAFEPVCGLNPKPALRLQEFPAVAGQTLAVQALPLHVDPAALATHNRWLLAAAVPADRPYTLIVPVGDVTQAAGILANQRGQSGPELFARPALALNAAEVQVNQLRALIALPGETAADLAQRGHQRLGEFLHHNELTGFDAVVVGRPYFLERKRDEAAVEYHVLQPNETLMDVAQKYGMREKAVRAKNRLARVEELRPGRLLWLQHPRPRETAIEYRALAESAPLERPLAAVPMSPNAVMEQLNQNPPARLTESSDVTKVKIKVKNGSLESKRVLEEAGEGWGEAVLPAPVAAPVPGPVARLVSAPLPARAAPRPAAAKMTYQPSATAPTEQRPSAAKMTYQPSPTPVAAHEVRLPDSTESITPGVRPVVAKPAATVVSAPAKVVAPSASKPAVVASAAGKTTHLVAPHETVYSIGRLHQLAPAALIALNRLQPPYGLTVGQVLALPETVPTLVAPAPKATPAPARTPAPASATALHPTGQVNPALLYEPQKAASVAPTAPVLGSATQHTVAKGETLYSIARLYKVTVADLQAWNGKAEGDASAKMGEVLRVTAGRK